MEFLKLKKSNCKNCHKCIRHCPVKSIKFSGNQAHIVEEECILCGQCFVVCPQNAKQIVDETEAVGVLLRGDAPVYASVAPSFAAYFDGAGIGSLETALKAIGFEGAEETAIGATMVKREYERLAREGKQDVIITSCCHTVNLMIEKYFPTLSGCLAPVITPMNAHCNDMKRRFPGAKTVFIGPCLSKKDEAYRKGIDAALTFEELTNMLDKAGVTVATERDSNAESRARLFPTTGGILRTMTEKPDSYTYLTVDGLDNCKSVLNDIAEGSVHRCFIEMSSCNGSCIGGPIMEKYHCSPVRHYKAIDCYAGKEDFDTAQPATTELAINYEAIITPHIMPTEQEIKAILAKMNKHSKDDELNCGTCGYDTCREKAIAIFQGKAEVSMCLPYLMEQTESFSSSILDNTPNGIIAVNSELEVQQINPAAMRLLKINSRTDVMGESVMRILDPVAFVEVQESGRQIHNKRDYYAEYGRFLELTIVKDKTSGGLIAIIRDVSEQENERKQREELGRQTAETADKVVDKQMRIVQEIASLLGETAAETKIALTKLKESLQNEEEE